ncbi:MAG: hypothetical protein P4L28_00010 [Paludibacteraceae bacterium]|nr:hypothetical protein [Paludibacteraceae bacterium]
MARTIATIKADLTHKFLSSEQIQSAYQLKEADVDNFESIFSPVSLESIFFYVVAAASWTLEKLFDAHKAEVSDIIATLTPHTLQWYATKAKAFQYQDNLVTDTDYYATIDTAKQIVTFAAALENDYSVYLKVATGSTFSPTDGSVTNKGPLDDDQLKAFKSYINRVKDAGVNLQVISEKPDVLYACITIYYDPLVMSNQGLVDNKDVIQNCILNFIQSLPFNGELRVKALEDALAAIDGVVMPEVRGAAYSSKIKTDPTYFEQEAYQKPYSGYFKINHSQIDILGESDKFTSPYNITDYYSVHVKFVEYVTVQN